jgi:hypothetical protein
LQTNWGHFKPILKLTAKETQFSGIWLRERSSVFKWWSVQLWYINTYYW